MQAQTVLQRVLRGRLTFTLWTDGLGYDFSAPTRFDRLFTGIVVPVPVLPSWIPEGDVTGTEHIGPWSMDRSVDRGQHRHVPPRPLLTPLSRGLERTSASYGRPRTGRRRTWRAIAALTALTSAAWKSGDGIPPT
jgi:hypothetical protein